MKAFLGMGLLGSNFVKAMRRRGEEVQVWNRTASRATELEQYGVKAFSNVAEAVSGADIIHVALKDDASVNEVLEAASSGLMPGAIIVDHTTTTKAGATERTTKWKEKGFLYQHAPVFMGPTNALEGSGFMLLSGDEALIRQLEPELAKMTGRLLHFGPEVGKAAAMKLVGNTFLVCVAAGIRETLLVSKSMDVLVDDLTQLFDSWNPASMLQARLQKMSSGDYEKPSWELNMARKDTGLFIKAAEEKNIELLLMPVIAQLMDTWIEKGYGSQDWTVIGKDSI